MPHCLFFLLVAILCLAVTTRAEDKPSPAVKRILDKAVAEVKKNRQEFDKENAKPLGEAKKALEELSTKLIKDGKTDEATAILGQVKTLEADVMKMANAPAPVPVPAGGGRPVPQKPLLERMEGKWENQNPNAPTSFTIERNGVMKEFFKTGAFCQEVQLKVMPDGTAEGVYPHGQRRKVSEVTADKLVIQTWNGDGSMADTSMMNRSE